MNLSVLADAFDCPSLFWSSRVGRYWHCALPEKTRRTVTELITSLSLLPDVLHANLATSRCHVYICVSYVCVICFMYLCLCNVCVISFLSLSMSLLWQSFHPCSCTSTYSFVEISLLTRWFRCESLLHKQKLMRHAQRCHALFEAEGGRA